MFYYLDGYSSIRGTNALGSMLHSFILCWMISVIIAGFCSCPLFEQHKQNLGLSFLAWVHHLACNLHSSLFHLPCRFYSPSLEYFAHQNIFFIVVDSSTVVVLFIYNFNDSLSQIRLYHHSTNGYLFYHRMKPTSLA